MHDAYCTFVGTYIRMYVPTVCMVHMKVEEALVRTYVGTKLCTYMHIIYVHTILHNRKCKYDVHLTYVRTYENM